MIRIIDRYLIKQFLMTLCFALGALSVIFIIVHVLEHLEQFLDKDASIIIICKFYLHYLPEIFKLLTPVSTLLATLFTIGRLSTNNEITAMKSAGMSLYRLMVPFVFISLLISFGQLFFNGWYVPFANKSKHEIENKYLNNESGKAPLYNLYFRDTPSRNIIFQYYNSETKSASNISIEDFTSEKNPRLIKRIEAKMMNWDEKTQKWMLINAITRNYYPQGAYVMRQDSLSVKINTTDDQIEKLQKSEDEMNLTEKSEFIQILKQGGKDVRKQLIDYYSDYAFPFANLIVVLFGVPFASVKRKQGIAIQIGAAMIISFTYMISAKISQTIGYASNVDPILTGWLSNGIFFIAGLVTIFKTKT